MAHGTDPLHERLLAGLKRSPAEFRTISTRINRVLVMLYGIAIVALLIDHGFHLSDWEQDVVNTVNMVIIGFFLVHQVIKIAMAPNRGAYVRERRFEYVLSAVLLGIVVLYPVLYPAHAWLADVFNIHNFDSLVYLITQGFILLSIVFSLARYSRRLPSMRIQPARLFVGSFIFVILLGTFGLMLPKSTVGGIRFVDALFTSTSAVCVTGLCSVDTGATFTYQGLTIIMLLIQIGGLGLMTVTTFFAIFHGVLGVRERVFIQEFTNSETMGQVRRTLVNIILFTLAFEAVGAVILFLSWEPTLFTTVPERVFGSAFHAVSAFCNAGFSTMSLNIADPRVQFNPGVNLTICSLIVFGGMGFAVMANVVGVLRNMLRRRRKLRRLTVHSRIVLIATAILIFGGMAIIYILEYGNTLAGLSQGDRLLASFFQSITTRTAGFNTINIGALATPTVFIMIIWMFIGASPGSTGGGIKTTTASIIFLSALNIVRGKMKIELFHRRISEPSVERAYAIATLSFILVVVSTLLLTMIEPWVFSDVLFEVVSAFGTVGLSRGITPQLTDASKYILALTMLIGRVGVMMLVMAVSSQVRTQRYEYPTEDVPVG